MAIHVWGIPVYPIFRHLGFQAAAVPHAALGIEAAVAVPPWNQATSLGFIQVWD